MYRFLSRRASLTLYFSVLAGMVAVNAQDKFQPPCAQPHYPEPSTSSLMIDAQCVIQGASQEVDSNPAEGDQNEAKNNFCGQDSGGAVKTSDMKNLQDMVQQDHTINFGRSGNDPGPTTDRTKLQNLGQLSEGKVVVFTGFVLKVRQEGGESVNCELGKPPKPAKGSKTKSASSKSKSAIDALHDIHISLVDSKTITNECRSIVAEMSPHHRPPQWIQKNVDRVRKQRLQVRVTGQLFFDSSHDLPCVNGKPPAHSSGNPVRVALWEIHPIYEFEVCPSGTCATSGWKSLSDWVDGN
jgi:hypothetical protein